MDLVKQVFVPAFVDKPFVNKSNERVFKAVGFLQLPDGKWKPEPAVLFISDELSSAFQRAFGAPSSDGSVRSVTLVRELQPLENGGTLAKLKSIEPGQSYVLTAPKR